MHRLLKACIPEKNVANIVIEYAQNGYKWYRLEYEVNIETVNEEGLMLKELNKGVIFNVKFDDDDYFWDNGFYKRRKPKTCEVVAFDDLEKRA